MSELRLSLSAAAILLAIHSGRRYGFDIMEVTGLPSGSVYPALRRLEAAKLIRSDWETCVASGGPERKYYKITPAGRLTSGRALERFPMLSYLGETVLTTSSQR